MVVKPCAQCGKPFEARTPRALMCGDTCRKAKSRGVTPRPPADPEAPAAPSYEGGFEKATRTELEKLHKLDTMLGQQALVIARRMSDTAETGAAVATLSKEHSRLMAAVSAGATTADPVDEARATRERDQREARDAQG